MDDTIKLSVDAIRVLAVVAMRGRARADEIEPLCEVPPMRFVQALGELEKARLIAKVPCRSFSDVYRIALFDA